jgi:hypothetical protein
MHHLQSRALTSHDRWVEDSLTEYSVAEAFEEGTPSLTKVNGAEKVGSTSNVTLKNSPAKNEEVAVTSVGIKHSSKNDSVEFLQPIIYNAIDGPEACRAGNFDAFCHGAEVLLGLDANEADTNKDSSPLMLVGPIVNTQDSAPIINADRCNKGKMNMIFQEEEKAQEFSVGKYNSRPLKVADKAIHNSDPNNSADTIHENTVIPAIKGKEAQQSFDEHHHSIANADESSLPVDLQSTSSSPRTVHDIKQIKQEHKTFKPRQAPKPEHYSDIDSRKVAFTMLPPTKLLQRKRCSDKCTET